MISGTFAPVLVKEQRYQRNRGVRFNDTTFGISQQTANGIQDEKTCHSYLPLGEGVGVLDAAHEKWLQNSMGVKQPTFKFLSPVIRSAHPQNDTGDCNASMLCLRCFVPRWFALDDTFHVTVKKYLHSLCRSSALIRIGLCSF